MRESSLTEGLCLLRSELHSSKPVRPAATTSNLKNCILDFYPRGLAVSGSVMNINWGAKFPSFLASAISSKAFLYLDSQSLTRTSTDHSFYWHMFHLPFDSFYMLRVKVYSRYAFAQNNLDKHTYSVNRRDKHCLITLKWLLCQARAHSMTQDKHIDYKLGSHQRCPETVACFWDIAYTYRHWNVIVCGRYDAKVTFDSVTTLSFRYISEQT